MKYGRIVRVGPNELSFSDPVLIKEIYGQGTPYMKTAFYVGFDNNRGASLFSTLNQTEHRDKRKLLSNAFAKISILASEPLVASQISKFLGWVDTKGCSAMDVFMWFRLLALDITSSLFMGEEFGALNQETPHPYLENLDSYFMIAGLR